MRNKISSVVSHRIDIIIQSSIPRLTPMKFYRLDEVPALREDQVFKVSPIGNGVATLIFYGLAGTCLVNAIGNTHALGMSREAYYFIAVITGLFGLIPLRLFKASLRPTNWLMRCNDGGIIIKYRAFENWRLPDTDAQAVGLAYAEIAWAKLVKERRVSPSIDARRSGNKVAVLTYMELGLAQTDTSALEKHLSRERNLRPDGKMVFCDYPVETGPGGIVKIRWSGGVTPGAHKAIEMLGRRVQIGEAESREVDLTHHRDANPEDERVKILTLARSGDEMGAAKLAQQAYGYSLSDATNYEDDLLAGEDETAAGR